MRILKMGKTIFNTSNSLYLMDSIPSFEARFYYSVEIFK